MFSIQTVWNKKYTANSFVFYKNNCNADIMLFKMIALSFIILCGHFGVIEIWRLFEGEKKELKRPYTNYLDYQ